VNWDDPAYVSENPHVQARSPRKWIEILDPRTLVASEWTPVVTAAHILERRLLGSHPGVYHASNVLLQLGCALAALALLRGLGLATAPALGAAAWYAVHPLQVEPVAWVAARKTLLSSLFFLLAALAYLRSGERRGRLTAFVLFVLALLSKATAVVLPAWLAALHLIRRERPRRRWITALIPFFVVAFARGLYTLSTQEGAVQETAALGLGGRLAAMGPVLATYARQIVWPQDLALLYASPSLAWTDLRVIGAWVLVAAAALAVALASRRDRRWAELGSLAALALLPTSNLLPAPFLQADRYLHLSLLGVAGLLALAVARIGNERAAAAVLLAWALALVPVSRARALVWHDDERLWRDALAHAPDLAHAHSNLGLYLVAAGRADEALTHLERAVAAEPGDPRWQVNLAAALVSKGDLAQARAVLERALAQSGSLAAAHGTLAVIALKEGRAEEALSHAERGASLHPGNPQLEVHVAEALAAVGRHEEAIAAYRRITDTYSFADAFLGWADLELELGRPGRADALYREILEESPEQVDALYNLATLRLQAGDVPAALELYDRLLAKRPGHAAAHSNRGSALLRLGRTEEAREAYARAVQAAPADPVFKTNLANVLGALGRCDEALPLYDAVLSSDPQSVVARFNRAACLLRLGRREEALPLLQALRSEGAYRERVEALLRSAEPGATP
jgi:tetratricopeptide (TPR) repeat protein